MSLIEAVNFDQSFSFVYSQRPGTPASRLEDNISPEVKKQRLQILQTRLTQQANVISTNMLNSTQNVLVTGKSKRDSNVLAARTENNRVVNFDGPSDLIGQMVELVITGVKTNTLQGELV